MTGRYQYEEGFPNKGQRRDYSSRLGDQAQLAGQQSQQQSGFEWRRQKFTPPNDGGFNNHYNQQPQQHFGRHLYNNNNVHGFIPPSGGQFQSFDRSNPSNYHMNNKFSSNGFDSSGGPVQAGLSSSFGASTSRPLPQSNLSYPSNDDSSTVPAGMTQEEFAQQKAIEAARLEVELLDLKKQKLLQQQQQQQQQQQPSSVPPPPPLLHHAETHGLPPPPPLIHPEFPFFPPQNKADQFHNGASFPPPLVAGNRPSTSTDSFYPLRRGGAGFARPGFQVEGSAQRFPQQYMPVDAQPSKADQEMIWERAKKPIEEPKKYFINSSLFIFVTLWHL